MDKRKIYLIWDKELKRPYPATLYNGESVIPMTYYRKKQAQEFISSWPTVDTRKTFKIITIKIEDTPCPAPNVNTIESTTNP